MKKSGERQRRQQKGLDTELGFIKFCEENRISCIKLEDDQQKRKEYLKNPGGPCPDFLCSKSKNKIFVEVKTHTLLTNEARNREMTQIVQAKRSIGLSGTTMFDPFDPQPELRGVFEGYLRSASHKFKNIKETLKFPRILLLNSYHTNEFDIRAIFWGAYPSFYRGGEYAGLKKEHSGLFDSTGTNVSAVIYWNNEQNRFEGIGNSKARIPLAEAYFKNVLGPFNSTQGKQNRSLAKRVS